MKVLKGLLRKWRAKGHGVHSPFAFHLITNVLYSPYAYNAFFDIENLLSKNNINPECVGAFQHLLFRLTYHFKPEKILEIGSAKGFSTLFLAAAHPDASITCIEDGETDIATAKKLLKNYNASVNFKKISEIGENEKFDFIVFHTNTDYTPDKERIFALSAEQSFWVFHPTHKPQIKPLLRNIVKDKRARVVFDMKQTNIIFLNPLYHKTTYYI